MNATTRLRSTPVMARLDRITTKYATADTALRTTTIVDSRVAGSRPVAASTATAAAPAAATTATSSRRFAGVEQHPLRAEQPVGQPGAQDRREVDGASVGADDAGRRGPVDAHATL